MTGRSGMAWGVGSVGAGILVRPFVRGGATVLVEHLSGKDGVRVAAAVALTLAAEVSRDQRVGMGRSRRLMRHIAGHRQCGLP